jgi:DNA-binding response OmpR family regulator
MQPPKSRILLVEDHEDTRELVGLVLTGCGYIVETAATLSEAADIVKARAFSLLMLDSKLPDGSGLDFCRSVRQFDRYTPIIFCSGLAYEEDKANAANAGAQAYFVKPIDMPELVKSVAALITVRKATLGRRPIEVNRKSTQPKRASSCR